MSQEQKEFEDHVSKKRYPELILPTSEEELEAMNTVTYEQKKAEEQEFYDLLRKFAKSELPRSILGVSRDYVSIVGTLFYRQHNMEYFESQIKTLQKEIAESGSTDKLVGKLEKQKEHYRFVSASVEISKKTIEMYDEFLGEFLEPGYKTAFQQMPKHLMKPRAIRYDKHVPEDDRVAYQKRLQEESDAADSDLNKMKVF